MIMTSASTIPVQQVPLRRNRDRSSRRVAPPALVGRMSVCDRFSFKGLDQVAVTPQMTKDTTQTKRGRQ